MGDEAPEFVVQAQQALAFIKRPKLTPALLQKPPFRFLHDIVSEVTKTTGFASGLYVEDELKSANIKDKDSKIAYLSKIIRCVELSLGVLLVAQTRSDAARWMSACAGASSRCILAMIACSSSSEAPCISERPRMKLKSS